MFKNIFSVGFWYCLLIGTALSAFSNPPQTAEQAFKFTSSQTKQNIILKWDIQPGNFLYKERIHWEASRNIQLQAPQWPTFEKHLDKLGIEHAIYQHSLELHLPYTAAQSQSITIQYQGCNLKGICFPPQKKTILIQANQAPKPQHIILELLGFLGIGILMAFTPCVLPMLPILTKIVVGEKQRPIQQTLGLAFAYVLGMACSYAIVGAVIAAVGKNLFILMQKTWISLTMAVVFSYLGLATLGLFEITLPQRWQNKSLNLRATLPAGHYLSALLMGAVSLLVLSPCVTAPLLGAITYITQLGQVWRGSCALFMLGLGMGIPLMIFAVSAGHCLPKVGQWMDNIKKILALFLFTLAALLISRVSSPPWNIMVWIVLGLITLYLFKPQTGYGRISNALRSVLCLGIMTYTGCLGFGLFKPAYLPWPFSSMQHHHTAQFILKNSRGLNQVLAAQSQHPVLLYFSAKWCTSCQYLEHRVWNNKALAPLLQKATLVKIDLSDNSDEQNRLMHTYKVLAPPTVILLEPIKKTATCRLLGEEITVAKLRHWDTLLNHAWNFSSCD